MGGTEPLPGPAWGVLAALGVAFLAGKCNQLWAGEEDVNLGSFLGQQSGKSCPSSDHPCSSSLTLSQIKAKQIFRNWWSNVSQFPRVLWAWGRADRGSLALSPGLEVVFTALMNSKGLDLFEIINPEIITLEVSQKHFLTLSQGRELSGGCGVGIGIGVSPIGSLKASTTSPSLSCL